MSRRIVPYKYNSTNQKNDTSGYIERYDRLGNPYTGYFPNYQIFSRFII